MELKGKRVVITGVTGLIGGHLAQRLLAKPGVQVQGLARNPQKGRELADQGVDIIEGDITRPASLLQAMADCQVVFHTAGWVNERGTKAEVWAVNVTGTQNVVEAALTNGVERFIHLSSCAVYGSLPQFDIDENTPPRLTGNLYGDSKVAAEQVIWQARCDRDLPVVVARPSQVYGPGSYLYSIRPVEVIKAGRMMLIDGGRHMCKPVYIDDLIDGLMLCAQIDEAVGQAINFTDGAPVPWRDFFGAYGRMLGADSFPAVPFTLAWLVGLFYEMRAAMKGTMPGISRRTVKALASSNSFSNQKARTLLGWEPKVDLDEGMQRTETWLRAEGYI